MYRYLWFKSLKQYEKNVSAHFSSNTVSSTDFFWQSCFYIPSQGFQLLLKFWELNVDHITFCDRIYIFFVYGSNYPYSIYLFSLCILIRLIIITKLVCVFSVYFRQSSSLSLWRNMSISGRNLLYPWSTSWST